MSAAVKPMHEAAIRQYAKQLRLPTVGGQFARLAEQAVKEKQSHLSYLEALLEGEIEERGRKAMARRIQEARFPAVKTLECARCEASGFKRCGWQGSRCARDAFASSPWSIVRRERVTTSRLAWRRLRSGFRRQ